MHKLTIIITLLAFLNTMAYAQINTGLSGGLRRDSDMQQTNTAAEYVFRNDADEVLMPVLVIGAVNRPGLYHVPLNTDLTKLLALTGGPLKEAELDEVVIKKNTNGNATNVDMKEILSLSNLKSPALASNDVVVIPAHKPTISPDTVTVLSIAIGVAGVLIGGFLAYRATVNK